MKAAQIKLLEKEAVRFRQEKGLGSSDALNINSLLLKLKVLTVFRPLSEHFSGMSLKDAAGHRFMLINSAQAVGRQHFTIAHELYHLFIETDPKPHKCMNEGVRDADEQKADQFASLLLMPEDGLLQLLSKEEIDRADTGLASVIKLEQYFAVSRRAILNRLSDIGMLSKENKQKFAALPVIPSAQDYGYSTALYRPENRGLIIGDYGEKARLLFDSEKISEGHYHELLNKLNYDDPES